MEGSPKGMSECPAFSWSVVSAGKMMTGSPEQSPEGTSKCPAFSLSVPCRQDDEEEYRGEVLSPEASQRITAAACSVAEQVERAVTLAVQAISPGVLQILYTLNHTVNPES